MTFEQLLKLADSDKPARLCLDSRLVKQGDIFVAVEGTIYDGHDFIDQALAGGAKYIVAQKPHRVANAELITVDDCAQAAAILAQSAAQHPASKLTNLAVTGTNGKTTVAYFVQSCIRRAGEQCGLIGTIICDTGASVTDSGLTTPDCLAIAQSQQQMIEAGAKYMIIEASSHALDQNRLAAIDFKAAAFTNLTGDHLDYHKTKAEYLIAKTRLFEALSPQATAVLNKQSPESEQIAKKTKAKILSYAVEEPADLTAHIESMDTTGTSFLLEYAGNKYAVKTPLLGRHNVSNALAAAGLCLAAGFDPQTVAVGISGLKAVPGRLERIDWDGDFSVLIDYAHTDDALENVLTALKPFCKARLIVLFGCGGDRDTTKRPRMATVAEESADFVIVTSDNPRTESPDKIINQIVTGFKNPDSPAIAIEPDRKKAIELALTTAQTDDIVLIAGKGHETYQVIGKQKFDFSDFEIARKLLVTRNEKMLS